MTTPTTPEPFHFGLMISYLRELEGHREALSGFQKQREEALQRLSDTQQELEEIDAQISVSLGASVKLNTIWELSRPVVEPPMIVEKVDLGLAEAQAFNPRQIVEAVQLPEELLGESGGPVVQPESSERAETAETAVQDAPNTDPIRTEASPETQPEPEAANPVDDDEARVDEQVAPPAEISKLPDTERIFTYLLDHPNSIRKDIQAGTGLSEHAVRKALKALQADRRIMGTGEYPTFYSLTRVGPGVEELTEPKIRAKQLAERNGADEAAVKNAPQPERDLPPFYSPSNVTAELKAKALLVLKDLGRPSSQTMIRNRVGSETRLTDLQAALKELAADGLVFQNGNDQWAVA